jgi:hypothetical protein
MVRRCQNLRGQELFIDDTFALLVSLSTEAVEFTAGPAIPIKAAIDTNQLVPAAIKQHIDYALTPCHVKLDLELR